ncbi:MAG: molybdopterin-guanine dinucleotide biosynthesis protein B [Clostridiales bacterium]|nr:molybdopterin-guanine dinucleotide biosynthesis protein B [Clostridiales bacterium]
MLSDCSAAILCGGLSRRMGQNKAELLWKGDTFLSHLEKALEPFGSLYISLNSGQTYNGILGIPVIDRYEQCGPLGGLHALLSECKTERLFVTTVDLPRTDLMLAEEIVSFLTNPIEAVIPVAVDGKLHPLCAAYRKSILPFVEKQLATGNYRVRDLLARLRVCYVPIEKLTDGAIKLENINTPDDYQNFLEIPVFSVVAYSGSGKTTFLEKLIPELKNLGIHLAVIKHDAHDFEIDRPGKDSARFTQAGADTVILTSDHKSVRMDHYPVSAGEWIRQIQDVDLILTEGYKHGSYQKILLFREAAGKPPAMDLKTEQPFCIVSDRKKWPETNCPVYGLDDAGAVAKQLLNAIRLSQYNQNT